MVQFACRSPYANLFSISTDARETLGLDDETMVCVAVIQPHMIETDISRANSAFKSISNPSPFRGAFLLRLELLTLT
jgi:hypothetical protein